MLNTKLQDQIKEYSLLSPEEEKCGLILESGNNVFIYPCQNISSNKEHHFELNPMDYLRAWNNGKNQVIGIFHSQKGSPSSLDYYNASGHGIYSIVYSINEDKFYEIRGEYLKWKKYLGKYFEIGKQDCFTLVQNFYKNEYNINIGDYARGDGWFKKNPNIIQENASKEKFIDIGANNKLNEGDILVFNYGHFGIYIDIELLLHHPRNKNSIIEQLTTIYKQNITNVYRHESKYGI